MVHIKGLLTKVTAVTRYQAEDGAEFPTAPEAESHNIKICIKGKISDWVYSTLNDSEDPRDGDDPFLTLDDVQDAILGNCTALYDILMKLRPTSLEADTAIVPRKATDEMLIAGVKRFKDTMNKNSVAGLWDIMVSVGEIK